MRRESTGSRRGSNISTGSQHSIRGPTGGRGSKVKQLDTKLLWLEIAKTMKRKYGFKPEPEITLRDGMQVLQSRAEIETSQRALLCLSIPGFISSALIILSSILREESRAIVAGIGCSLLLTLCLANGKMASKVDYYRQYEEIIASDAHATILKRVYRKSSKTRLSGSGPTTGRRSTTSIGRASLRSTGRTSTGNNQQRISTASQSAAMANFTIPASTADYCGGSFKHNVEIRKQDAAKGSTAIPSIATVKKNGEEVAAEHEENRKNTEKSETRPGESTHGRTRSEREDATPTTRSKPTFMSKCRDATSRITDAFSKAASNDTRNDELKTAKIIAEQKMKRDDTRSNLRKKNTPEKDVEQRRETKKPNPSVSAKLSSTRFEVTTPTRNTVGLKSEPRESALQNFGPKRDRALKMRKTQGF